ncbi:MAG: hypothetical protein WBW41_01530, partial [Verrucomicrobiia bacterium]
MRLGVQVIALRARFAAWTVRVTGATAQTAAVNVAIRTGAGNFFSRKNWRRSDCPAPVQGAINFIPPEFLLELGNSGLFADEQKFQV